MAFEHGKNTHVFINTVDVSQYFDNVDFSADADTAETTTFNGTWKTYLAGMTGAKFDLSGLYDPAFDDITPILGAESGDLLRIGMADGSRYREMIIRTTNYTESSPVGGAVAFKWSVLGDGAVTFG